MQRQEQRVALAQCEGDDSSMAQKHLRVEASEELVLSRSELISQGQCD